AGNVNVGSHSYVLTEVIDHIEGDTTVHVETLPSDVTAIVTTTSADGQVSITNILPGPDGCVARNLYRTKATPTPTLCNTVGSLTPGKHSWILSYIDCATETITP